MIASLFIPILLCTVSTSAQWNDIKQYQSDYAYNVKTKPFYKVHIESEPIWRVKTKYQLEDAEPVVVASKQDIMQAHAMFKPYPDIGDWLLTGAAGRTEMLVEKKTVDVDLHISDNHEERRPSWRSGNLMNRQGEVMSSNYINSIPFVCKVDATNAYYDSHCKVYGRAYTQVPNVESYYKIPRVATKWDAAFEEYDAKGAHLTPINSEAEHRAIKHTTTTAPAIATTEVASSAQQNDNMRYRPDYIYNKKTKSFYKLHFESEPIWRATKKCELEGAELMVVTSKQDIMQAHIMFQAYPDIGDVLMIGADRRSENLVEQTTMKFNSASWRSSTVMNRQGEVMSSSNDRSVPFICKVEAIGAYYDSHCKVYGRGYTYEPHVGSCYKFSSVAANWIGAAAACDADGAHLVIINSDAEHRTIKQMITTAPAVDHATKNYFFFAGFRANKPINRTERVFKTIFDQTLDEAGFNVWNKNEPNNYKDNEYCGCIFKNNGFFNDIDCMDTIGYICEKEIGVNV